MAAPSRSTQLANQLLDRGFAVCYDAVTMPKAKASAGTESDALTERYTLPGHGRTAMFDFYALYALWWEVGEGKDALGYGGHIAVLAPHRRRTMIGESLSECAYRLGKAMVEETRRQVYSEAEDCCDENLVPPQALGSWLRTQMGPAYINSFKLHGAGRTTQPEAYWRNATFEFPKFQDFWDRLGWAGARAIFMAPFWPIYADAYGGKKWAMICDRAEAVERAMNHGVEIKDLVSKIDHMFDLEHQTGLLFDRPDCKLRITKADLDRRFNLRSLEEYIGLVSPQVERLIITSRRYLESVEVVDLAQVRFMVDSLLERSPAAAA